MKRAIPHQNYDPVTLQNDIAILLLSSAIPEGRNARPIKISKEKDLEPGSTVTVSGWGDVKLTPNEVDAQHLKIAHLTVVRRSICGDLWAKSAPPTAITNDMICAINAKNSVCFVSITQ